MIKIINEKTKNEIIVPEDTISNLSHIKSGGDVVLEIRSGWLDHCKTCNDDCFLRAFNTTNTDWYFIYEENKYHINFKPCDNVETSFTQKDYKPSFCTCGECRGEKIRFEIY